MHMRTRTSALKIVSRGRYPAGRDNVVPKSPGLLKISEPDMGYFLMRCWSQRSLRSPKTMQALATPLDHSPKLADKILLKMAYIVMARTSEIKLEPSWLLLPAG